MRHRQDRMIQITFVVSQDGVWPSRRKCIFSPSRLMKGLRFPVGAPLKFRAAKYSSLTRNSPDFGSMPISIPVAQIAFANLRRDFCSCPPRESCYSDVASLEFVD